MTRKPDSLEAKHIETGFGGGTFSTVYLVCHDPGSQTQSFFFSSFVSFTANNENPTERSNHAGPQLRGAF